MKPTHTPETPKVFGIGLSRTASKTLDDSLKMLGYRSHFVVEKDNLDSLLNEYDAFTHYPLAEKYVELDERFPGAKFILTVREREEWLKSCEFRKSIPTGASSSASRSLQRRVYGTEEFDRELYSAAYDRHYDQVCKHFRGREDSLLIIDICGGEGFEKLCPFLGKETPQVAFPYSKKNTRVALGKPQQKVKRFLVQYLKADKIKRFVMKLFGR